MLRKAVQQREPATPPLEALHQLAHRLVADRIPILRFSDMSRRFIETVERSETLKARARQIRDELASELALSLAASVGRASDDPEAQLAANLLLAAWTTAFIQAHRTYRRSGDGAAAERLFVAVADRAARGLAAAMAGTPYADRDR